MAGLDFLGSLGGLANGLGQAGSVISAVGGLFGNKQKVPAAATEAMNIQSSMLRGLTGGNSPEFNNMMQAEQNNSRTALLKAINEIVRQNRRSMTRGPVGLLVNPDRRDEAIARSLMGVYENETDRARAKTKQDAISILSGAGGVAQNALRLEDARTKAGSANALNMSQGFQKSGMGIKDLLSSIGSFNSDLGAGGASTTINEYKPRGYNPKSGMFGGV